MLRLSTLFIVLAAFVIACGSEGPSSEQIAEGKATYEKFCVACHGAKGELQMNGAKDFTQSEMTLNERIEIITKGKNMMVPFKGVLNVEEIKNVAAYTLQLTKGKI
ncbi:MAG: cytochrome c [Bacteroidota bacterium]